MVVWLCPVLRATKATCFRLLQLLDDQLDDSHIGRRIIIYIYIYIYLFFYRPLRLGINEYIYIFIHTNVSLEPGNFKCVMNIERTS